MDRPTREHVLINGRAFERYKKSDHAPLVPHTFVPVPASSTRCAGSTRAAVTAPQPRMAEVMSINDILLERARRVQELQLSLSYDWGQHPHDLIAGITPLPTPPGQAELMYDDAIGMNRGLPVSTHVHHAHTQELQCQNRPCIHGYGGRGQTKRTYLPHHPQSEKDFLAQHYAGLPLADTGANQIPHIPALIPEAPAALQQPQIVTETRSTGTTAAGSTGLTITTITTTGTGAGATTTTRTITGPDGTVLVPPPIPAHPGCELSPQMAKVMDEYGIEHVCDYLRAKKLLRDKIVKKVLDNTQDKLMELLQKELDRMSSEEEEEEEEDADLDLLDSDMEDGGETTGRRQEGEVDWTFAG
ncbi:hypothetical protein GE21DRAFT_9743 [Neurospora crassa]|uniref:Uncharacterized protein n=1 Tax=Neurospora crassa (strain ATCC 24698 / 74-OR23-1A / CBS 708.71 / DSM 1257 / FGSC 987) TaxID=367110 RepID=Q7S1U7_NEUCR|nr:hypothetical protein NCU09052 [Neurospora crassa OR74A]EAA29320.2 hypothetical protein NCU09052 [Neurospora crassa OR74A]KHE86180.1 hypothetical protein GE21DRAFT_9743 [Neurospora crassa]|eukprot:XP_958556.2 hypothetical protein NCU09052 [Neurospora crassa OR74A]